MTCNETRPLLNAYVDGELDSAGSLAVERHVQDCSSCSTGLAGFKTLAAGVASRELRFTAPPRLKKNVRYAIRAAAPGSKTSVFPWRWVAVAASLVLILALTWNVATRRAQPSLEAQLIHDIVSSHVRSMMANHLTDVSSSDSHTVKPWFGGKLDYSPPAVDLTQDGFRLIGGRLDYVQNRQVAAIVYQRSQHLINLFVWPAEDGADRQETRETVQGYNVLHWTRSGMTYWLISELNQAELNECARLLKEKIGR